MNDMQAWIAKEHQVCAHNYHPLPVVLEKGEGVWLYDILGNRYLDMMSAYSAVSHGHANPRLVRILSEQAAKLCVPSRAFHSNTLLPFLEKLCHLSGLDMALPMNTGAEAVETALKAARRWGYEKKGIPENRAEIIVAQDNFHGRTISIISFSTDSSYQSGFGPFTPGFKAVPFGDANAIAQAITPNTCAVLLEPMQGEAGVKIPPTGYLKEVSALCKQNNVLLILDEIQTGLGRTGKMFAFQHEKIQPDGIVVGKALGGGLLPVSAFVARREVMSVFTPGSHGSTFGGSALAAAVGLEALNILEEDHLVEHSARLGERLIQGLQKISSPFIKDIRGKGLWVGMEIDTKKISARTVCEALMKEGVLSKEAHDTVIRFAPPLVIQEAELDWAIERISSALKTLQNL